MLKNFTGSPYFPGGLEIFKAKQNEFLVFENGPSQDVELQWVSYKDAADQCSLSRIWGGIHPYIDDIPGRMIGEIIGNESFDFGAEYFENNLSVSNNLFNDIRLLKNPVRIGDEIVLINVTGNENFILYNLNGQKISFEMTYDNNNIFIPTSHLSQGIYILKSNEISFKVIVR